MHVRFEATTRNLHLTGKADAGRWNYKTYSTLAVTESTTTWPGAALPVTRALRVWGDLHTLRTLVSFAAFTLMVYGLASQQHK